MNEGIGDNRIVDVGRRRRTRDIVATTALEQYGGQSVL